MSVRIRPCAEDDAPWLRTWLPAVADAAGASPEDVGRWLGTGRELGDVRRHIIERNKDRAGFIAWDEHGKSGNAAAVVHIVATPPECSRKGIGMKAAALLEAELEAEGLEVVYAPAPAAHGISMYFWIRLGYAPIARDLWPCRREGVAWLMRRLPG